MDHMTLLLIATVAFVSGCQRDAWDACAAVQLDTDIASLPSSKEGARTSYGVHIKGPEAYHCCYTGGTACGVDCTALE